MGTRHHVSAASRSGLAFVTNPLQRPLLVAAFLAGISDAGLAGRRGDAIGRAALAADRFDAGVALLDGDGLALQRLFHQPFGFVAQRLLRHWGMSSSGFAPVLHAIAAIGNACSDYFRISVLPRQSRPPNLPVLWQNSNCDLQDAVQPAF